MSRKAKDLAMACEMVKRIPSFTPGAVIGVAGNNLAHSERLVALVRKLAAESDVDVSHVTLRPIATEHLRSRGTLDS